MRKHIVQILEIYEDFVGDVYRTFVIRFFLFVFCYFVKYTIIVNKVCFMI